MLTGGVSFQVVNYSRLIASQAAKQAAAGVAPDLDLGFDAEAVGAGGAGFACLRSAGLAAVSPLDELTSIALPRCELAAQRNGLLRAHGDGARARGNADGDDDDDSGAEADGVGNDGRSAAGGEDPEAAFKREVSETLLRAMLLSDAASASAQATLAENAVIELNALKIAEVRTFADCARYALTTLFDIQAPAATSVAPTFRRLFASAEPDAVTPAGQKALLAALAQSLRTWAPTLRKLLHDRDDAYQVLIALEEYCGEDGVFAAPHSRGRLFVPVFGHVLTLIYDLDLVGEDTFLEWEADKGEDDADDQVRLSGLLYAAQLYRHTRSCR